MKIIHWIGIDDHADKWTIAHLRGSEDKPAKEFELIPNVAGYRKLLAYARALGGTVRFVYEAGPSLTKSSSSQSYVPVRHELVAAMWGRRDVSNQCLRSAD